VAEQSGATAPSEPAAATGAEPVGYAAAADELEAILAELEDPTIDVDRLAERVRRAAELIAYCRQRITAARAEVTSAVARLSAVAPPADDGPAGDADSLFATDDQPG